MEKLTERRAQIFDSIIRIALVEGIATNENLPSLDPNNLFQRPNTIYYQYRSIIKQLDQYKIVEVGVKRGGFSVRPIPGVTDEFINNGGFLGLFYAQEKNKVEQNEIKLLEQKKLEYDLSYSKFLAKHKFLPYIFSGISILISIAALLYEILK